MRVLIVGAGTIGYQLAEQLSKEGHELVVVDHDEERLKFVDERLDVLTVPGHGASPTTLQAAEIEKVELLIAVTDSDELNMVVCLLARDYGVKTRIARVRNAEYAAQGAAFAKSKLAIDLVISPEDAAVAALQRLLLTPGATEIAEFDGGKFLLVGFEIPADAPLAGRNLAELRGSLGGEGFLIVFISRQGQVLIPRGEDVVAADDRIFVLMPQEILGLFLPMVHKRAREVKRVVIFGASRVGRRLAARLTGHELTLIEPDLESCRATAEELPRAEVLHGRGTDLAVLRDARIDAADAFVAASTDDEDNVMAALLARKHGAGLAAVLIEDPDYVPILQSLEIDIVVNPQLVTAGAILRFIRSESVLAVAKFAGEAAEALELVAVAGASGVGRPLKAVRLPRGALVGALLRQSGMVIPDGETIVAPGEKLIVFALSEAADAAQRFFTEKA